ncbi:MAG: glycine zipper domain-containing protein [Chlamydiota bacterium]
MSSKCITPIILCMLSFSCASKTASGALVGGGLGAATGGIVGGGKGALIGGAVGVIAGGLVGAALDEQDRRIMEQRSPSTVSRMDEGRPLTINDVIQLSEGGVSDETILGYMRQTGARYKLNQSQIRRMQNAGVSQRVINYMIDTGY